MKFIFFSLFFWWKLKITFFCCIKPIHKVILFLIKKIFSNSFCWILNFPFPFRLTSMVGISESNLVILMFYLKTNFIYLFKFEKKGFCWRIEEKKASLSIFILLTNIIFFFIFIFQKIIVLFMEKSDKFWFFLNVMLSIVVVAIYVPYKKFEEFSWT